MRKAIINRYKEFPWHPFLLGVFPTLALLANNITEIRIEDALRSLIVSLAAATLLTVILRLFLKDLNKAAAISSLALVLFFSYGHIYSIFEANNLAGLAIGRHRVLAPTYLVILAVGVGWITRPKRNLRLLTQTLNVVALAAVALPVLQISAYSIQERSAVAAEPSTAPQNLRIAGDQPAPDIYYIILDSYTRDDILKSFYKYDNSSFLNDLSSLGFYVARCSQSNYAQTHLSLASSLNMDFIDNLEGDFSSERTSRRGLPGLIKHSATRQMLESLGYKMIAFETDFAWSEVVDADIYLTPNFTNASLLDITGGFNSFEAMLIKTSALLIAVDGTTALPKFLQLDIDYPRQSDRERVLFDLDQLGKMPAMPGPKFVFAHIISPHKPFVFGPQGEIIERVKDNITGYRDQVAYLDSRLIPLLRKIIASSPTPPIIILQGDHGGIETIGQERMAILNAYYLPEEGSRLLYENISPVNTFRLIFNHYFGTRYDLLEDTSYFSSYAYPYQYKVVPNTRPGCP
jgi:hypothetical protein